MAIYLYSEDFADRFNEDQGLSDTTLVELNDTTTWMTEFIALFVGNPVEEHNINESDFYNNGYGMLKDAIVAYAEEELNGMFEFHMEYDSEGYLVDELKEERIIKAKAQDKLGYQLFRIYSITKNHENDNIVVKAQHITYDLANNFVESLVASSMTKKQVMEQIGNNTVRPHPFNVTSTNNSTQSSTELYRTNPLQMIAGMQGSVLQIWGGQIERDNFHLIMHDRRGSDDGVRVMYKKNITGLEATFDISGLVTRIYPFVYIDATDDSPGRLITVDGKYIDSDLINSYSQVYIKELDYSSDDRIDTQDKTNAEIRSQLTTVANRYFDETGNDKRRATMEVAFEHLWETEEYKDVAPLELVGMGDTVSINHSKLNVEASAIVNYIRYDCIAEINEEVKLGSVKARMSDSINRIERVEKEVEDVRNEANKAITSANGKNTTYYGPDEPTGKLVKGDTWFRVVDGQYTRTYRYDGIEWKLIFDMDSKEIGDLAEDAKERADEAYEGVENLTTVTESIGLRVGDLENPNLISHAKSDWIEIVTYHGLSEAINIIEDAEYTFEDFSDVKVDEISIFLEPSGKAVSVNPQGSTTFNSGNNNSVRFGLNIDDINFLNKLGSEYKFKLVEGTEIDEWSDGDRFSQFSQLRSAINLRVQKGDIVNQINISDEDILISGKKLLLDGDTYVSGEFKVGSANIRELDAAQVTISNLDVGDISGFNSEFITTLWNQKNHSVQITGIGLETLENGKITSILNQYGHTFFYEGAEIGAIGTSNFQDDSSYKGLRFALDNNADYMAWSFKESPSSTTYTTMFEWHKTADKVGVKGFHFADFVRMDYQLYVPAILNNTNNNILINPGINTSVVDASRVDVSNRLRTDEIGTLGYSTNRVVHLKSQNFDGATGFVMARNGTGGMLWLGTARAMLRANSGGGQPGYIELTENTVRSLTIYNKTYTSTTQQVRVTQNGVLGHSTSSRRYKLYEKEINLDYAKRILNIDAISWYDKRQAEERAAYLTKLNNGEECDKEDDCEEPITRIGGVIAEDMHDAGLEMFVEYDDKNRPNGISSNTWALFIPILKDYKKELEEHRKEINQLKELVKNEKRK